ncbi:MAG: agmatinase [Clostridia bacterium]
MRPLDALVSPRFTQIATFARLPHDRDLTDVDVAFLGIPFDDGTTYRTGARVGPGAIREQSRLLRPYNMILGVSPFEVLNVVDYGDVDVVPGSHQATARAIEETLGRILDARAVPLIAGGDHSITLPALRALRRAHGPVHLLHFDSHFDFWDQYWGERYTHGTWLRRSLEEGLLGRVAQLGIRGPQFSPDDFDYAAAHELMVVPIADLARDPKAAVERVLESVPPTEALYVSWDIDVVDPAYAMATGTPEVGGLTSREALDVVRAFTGHRLVGVDIVEVSPLYEGPAAITSLLAANLFYEFLSVLAKNRGNGLDAF